MKRLSKISVVLLISLLCILGLSTTAFAEETQSSDGLQASIATNSAEYKTNDDIKVELKVKNTNDFDINSVSMNTVVPNGLTVKDNASTSKTVGTLKSGNEESYSIILNVQSTSSGTGTTSTSPQTGNTASTSATTNGESSVGTGDVRNIAVLVIVLVISAVLMIYNRKKLSKHISIMLCFTICLTSIAAVGISSANAAEQDGFTVSKTIKVDDKSYTIGLKISYNKNSITDAVNLTGYKMSEASAYIENDLYADVEDLSHVAVDSDTLISFFDNEISFMVNDGVTERDVVDKIINKYDAVIVGKSSATGRYLIRFNSQTYTYDKILEIQSEIENNSLVYAAYPNYAIEMDDASYEPEGDLWSGTYDNIPSGDNWGMEAINAPEAWDYYDLMNNVNVGVFEVFGFESNHADLRNIVDRVENTHGTVDDHGAHVVGIIGAEFNNGIGINGVSSTAKISYIDAYTAEDDEFKDDETDTSSTFLISNACDFLIHHCECKVVNMSWGYKDIGLIYSASGHGDKHITALARLNIMADTVPIVDTLEKLLDKGYDFTICVSAGNNNNKYYMVKDNDCDFGYRPYDSKKDGNFETVKTLIGGKVDDMDAMYDKPLSAISSQKIKDRIIVVGATQNDGNGIYSLADYSCIGDRVDVVAPGNGIQSTVNNHAGESDEELQNNRVQAIIENEETNYYGIMDGTSMASPHVAGIAAILYSLNPDLTGKEVKDIICESATTNVNGTDKKMVNAEAAVKLLLSKGDYYTSPCKYSYERTVVDQNNNPIPDVKVTVTSYFKSGAELNHQDITTNSNGIFKFSEYAGKGKITLEKEGYETVTIEDNFEKGAIYVNQYPVTMKSKQTEESNIFEMIPTEFYFTSGAGGWRTIITINSDGSFVGDYVDYDLGDTGSEYPKGSAYKCNFTGRFTNVTKIDDYTYSMKVISLEQDGTQGDEYIKDGTRFTIGHPYGFDNADEFMLYLPGKPINELSDEFLGWVQISRESRETLASGIYGLYNVNEKQGFSGYDDNILWGSTFKYEYNGTRSELQPSSSGYSHITFWPETGAAATMNLIFYWKNDDQTEFEATETHSGGKYKVKIIFNEDQSKANIELEGDSHTNLTFWGGTSDGKFSAEYVRE